MLLSLLIGAASLCLGVILREGCPSQQQQQSTVAVSSSTHNSAVDEPLQALVSWLVSRLQSSASSGLGVVTPTLVVLATCPEARLVLDQMGFIGFLVRHLRRNDVIQQSDNNSNSVKKQSNSKAISVQQMYDLCFCLWTMTFEINSDENSNNTNANDIANHFHRDGAIVVLCELVQRAPREKVVRLAVSALRNLVATGEKSFVREMVACQLLQAVEAQLNTSRKSNDPDLQHDLEFLKSKLEEQHAEMTNWDVYQSEVESGHLQWGMVHTEKFFRDNARRMEGPKSDFAIVQRLLQIIGQQPQDAVYTDGAETTVAIALYDIGEFVRHYPNGRAVIKRFRGAKELIMSKLDHEDPEVARMALQCVSKVMVQNWQAVKDAPSST
jgi:V-type H+-transporting ATPase subunit H